MELHLTSLYKLYHVCGRKVVTKHGYVNAIITIIIKVIITIIININTPKSCF